MGWRTFGIELAGSIAWPVASIVIMWVLRNQIRALIRGNAIKNLRGSFLGMEFEAEFEQRTGSLARQAESIPLPAPSAVGIITDDLQKLPALINFAPAAAIMEAWSIIELELSRIGRTRGITEVRPFQLMELRRVLVDEGQISDGIASLIDDLRKLRNAVAHRNEEATMSETSAQDYTRMATQVVEALRRITG